MADWLAALLAWALFFVFRKYVIEPEKFGYYIELRFDGQFYKALMLIPLYWLTLHTISGAYSKPYRKTRLRELIRSFNTTAIGVILLFFFVLLDDEVQSYKDYYSTVGMLFGLQFLLTYVGRYILTDITRRRIAARQMGFNTLIIGSSHKAESLYEELENGRHSQGYFFRGFLTIDDSESHQLQGKLPHLGHYAMAAEMIAAKNIEEIIIAVESSQHGQINEILAVLEAQPVTIKIIPDMYDILTGSVKMNHLFDAPLIEVRHDIMPEWQQSVKRLIDVGFSIVLLIGCLPFFVVIAILIKLTSRGALFYLQERIGLHGQAFNIIKFRTMRVGAEQGTPQLSSKHDDRRTKVGKWLRKFRMDELPQFWCVLKGDMSLVGPRPERQFFIDQIVKQAPHYSHLLKVRPGVTSWGQVKFGYAESVDQMVERMKYDIIYIENMTLALDFRILFHTVLVVLRGRGK
ncbi:MAG: sugar transferase [Flavobacteriaceae bacterium]|nr:sugar transferase [Flavobacteriaceae bacterium]